MSLVKYYIIFVTDVVDEGIYNAHVETGNTLAGEWFLFTHAGF
jgi:hypothetical protein